MSGYIERSAQCLDPECSDQQLGASICESLLAFASNGPKLTGKEVKSDWPMFKLSGVATMRKFERDLVDVNIQTRGAELVFYGSPRASKDFGIGVQGTASLSCVHTEVGATARKVFHGVLALRSAGIV